MTLRRPHPRAAGHAAAPDPCPHQRACRPSAGHPGLRARTRHQGRGTTATRGFAIIWLHFDGDHLTEVRHCVACQPYEPVIDVSLVLRRRPLITGQPPELDDQLAPAALDWLHSRGWQLHLRPLCSGDQR